MCDTTFPHFRSIAVHAHVAVQAHVHSFRTDVGHMLVIGGSCEEEEEEILSWFVGVEEVHTKL